MSMALAQVRKRDGRIVPFDRERIINAIFKAAQAVGQEDGRGDYPLHLCHFGEKFLRS